VSAGKPPYIAVSYGATRAGRPGTIVTLGTCEKRSVTIGLVHGAAISGKVLDDHGDAVPGARVRVLQRRDVAGEIALSGDMGEPAGATTDDRGVYRVFGLPPGDYAVAVQPRRTINGAVRLPNQQTPAADGPTAGFESLYFGDTLQAASSTAIALAAGQERTDVDVHVKLVPLVRVDGTLATGDTAPPRNLQIILRPRGSTPPARFSGARRRISRRMDVSRSPASSRAYTIYAHAAAAWPAAAERRQSGRAALRPALGDEGRRGRRRQRDERVARAAARGFTHRTPRRRRTESLPEDLPAIRVGLRPTLASGQIPPLETVGSTPRPLHDRRHRPRQAPSVPPDSQQPRHTSAGLVPEDRDAGRRDVLDAPLEVTPDGCSAKRW
jgi:hypothetical protein